MKYLFSVLLRINPIDRPSADDLLKHFIPLVYRSLGKLNGYAYESSADEEIASNTLKSAQFFGAESNREYLEASTATMNDFVLSERSVLYQMKSFGSSFTMDPLHLPPTCKIKEVTSSGSHFIVVTEGMNQNFFSI